MQTTKQIYTKDKSLKITFRADAALSEWITERASVVGLSPSAFIRQIIYQNMYAERTLGNMVKSGLAGIDDALNTNINTKARTETAALECKQQS